MERSRPKITWYESTPRPPFNGDLLDDLPPNPELDRVIQEIVEEDLREQTEGGIVKTVDEYELGMMAELHATREE